MIYDLMGRIDTSDPKTVLSILEIGILIGTVIWVFAFMQSDINRNTERIDRHQEMIEMQTEKQASNDIRFAVTDEQYKQIMAKLEELSVKMDKR